MKPQDRYLMFVQWSEEDQLCVGFCPDLFPFGGVCYGPTPVAAYSELCEMVEETVKSAEQEGISLPPPATRPMREAVPA